MSGPKKMELAPSRIWFPNVWQVVPSRNDSYLHSLFVGLTSPLINLPHYLWLLVASIGEICWMFLVSVLSPMIYGVLGRVNTYEVPAGFACVEVQDDTPENKA
ncbi:hypothetical protein [Cupriavidus campinensis]|uniref:DUF2628 domain-containing protein n=1 Tax=Cupriavidus campinensis TaxID=151783 RepID=A0ABY3ET03_9BURK|nr:hypothetical protein [Cupriavidus campinensis]TSP14030.1 hypothetical protein FGG12_06050 [Cupriavidus campinensis]